MLVDYHIHAVGHGEYAFTREWANQYLDNACRRGIKEIGFSEHDEFARLIDLDLFYDIQNARRNNINLKLGIEMDYIPGREKEIEQTILKTKYDYAIGSIHFIDGWGFDHPDFKRGFEERDIDEVYAQYAKLLIQMVQSGCFDIVGHIDLVKIWGHRPRKRSPLYYLEPVLQTVKKHKLAVEINSAGLRKEVAELYPAASLVEQMFRYGIPITFGSDAHHPDQIGEGLAEAYQSARQAGYRYLVRFDQHRQIVTAMENFA